MNKGHAGADTVRSLQEEQSEEAPDTLRFPEPQTLALPPSLL